MLRYFITSSLDGRIKLWDPIEIKLVVDLRKSEERGCTRTIAGMSYSQGSGHYIVTWGFELSIVIWNPVLSLSRSHIGLYKGHIGIITICRMFKSQPNCCSVDEKEFLRIWNVKTLETSQVINLRMMGTKINFIHMFNNDNFLIGGKRLFYLYNEEAKAKIKQLDDVYPQFIDFNSYSKQFIVVSLFDIRVYESRKGRLKEIFTKLLPSAKNSINYLTAYIEGARARKFYLGDNAGSLRNFNMNNAELLKQVNNIELEKTRIDHFCRVTSFKSRESSAIDITCLLYVQDYNVLICGTKDSSIKIYDESNAEESELLRFFIGGHNESEITALAFNSEQNLVASGSENGIVSLWDTSKGKLEYSFFGHRDKIVSLGFGSPFPVLISASLDGTICVWGHKPLKNEQRHSCICRFLNFNYLLDNREDSLIPFTGMTTFYQFGAKEYSRRSENLHRKVIIDEITGVDYLSKENIEKSEQVTPHTPETCIIPKKSHRLKRRGFILGTGNHIRKSILNPQELFTLGKNSNSLDSLNTLKDAFKRGRSLGHTQEIKLEEFMRMQKSQIDTRASKSNHLYVITADKNGTVTVGDLSPILDHLEIECSVPTEKITKEKEDNIRRNESINAYAQSRAMIESAFTTSTWLMPCYDIRLSLMNFEFQAHTEEITSLNINLNEKILMTSSKDRTVAVWNYSGELKGRIDIKNPQNTTWNFAIDWVKLKLEEFDQAFRNLELIEGQKVPEYQQEKYKRDFLFNSFIKPEFLQKEIDNEEPESVKTMRFYNSLLAKINLLKKQASSRCEDMTKNFPELAIEANENRLPRLRKTNLHDTDFREIVPETTRGEKLFKHLNYLEDNYGSVIINNNLPKKSLVQRLNSPKGRRSSQSQIIEITRPVKKSISTLRSVFESSKALNRAEKVESIARTPWDNLRKVSHLIKGSLAFKDASKQRDIEPTDIITNDFTGYDRVKKHNRDIAGFPRRKKKQELPDLSRDLSEVVIRNHNSFMEQLSDSYTNLARSFRYRKYNP